MALKNSGNRIFDSDDGVSDENLVGVSSIKFGGRDNPVSAVLAQKRSARTRRRKYREDVDLRSCFRWLRFYVALAALREIGIEKTEHVRVFDRAHAFLFLQLADALPEVFHFRPMHFWTEMVLGVIAVVKKEPVVNFVVNLN